MRNLYLFFIALFAFQLNSIGQTVTLPTLPFSHLNAQNGLSQCVNPDLFTDQKGVLWISSWDGINRFDGIHCTTIRRHDNADSSIYDNKRVWRILDDAEGNMWFGTETLAKYDKAKNVFKSYFLSYENNKALKDFIVPFYADNQHQIWMFAAKYQQIVTFNSQTEKFDTTGIHTEQQVYNYVQNSLPHNAVDTIWTWTEDKSGLSRRVKNKENKWTLAQLFADNGSKLPKLTQIHHLIAQNDVIWISAKEGLVAYNWRTQQCSVYNEFKHTKWDNFCWLAFDTTDHQNRAWVGTRGNGLFWFDIQKKQFIAQYRHDDLLPNSLSGDDIQAVEVDKLGNLRVAVIEKGVDYCNLKKRKFNKEFTKTKDKRVWWTRMAEDKDGHIWLSQFEHGVVCYDRTKETIVKALKFEPKNGASLSSNRVRDIMRDKSNRIWFATDKGICFYDPKTYKVVRIPNPSSENNGWDGFLAIEQFKDGSIYTTDGNNLFRVSEDKNGWHLHTVKIKNGQLKAAYRSFLSEISDNEFILGSLIFNRLSPDMCVQKGDISDLPSNVPFSQKDKLDTAYF